MAALAVVIAGTGTALAVSSTVVRIQHGGKAGRFAHDDQHGQLNTTGVTSTINIETIAQPNSKYELTDPTTARHSQLTQLSGDNQDDDQRDDRSIVGTPRLCLRTERFA